GLCRHDQVPQGGNQAALAVHRCPRPHGRPRAGHGAYGYGFKAHIGLRMQTLLPLAEQIAARLVERRESIAVAEGSAGGLISTALLAVPGASKYFLGSAVIYTASARSALLAIEAADMAGLRPASEPYATLLARRVREKLGATWGLAETGASGPSGNRYG